MAPNRQTPASSRDDARNAHRSRAARARRAAKWEAHKAALENRAYDPKIGQLRRPDAERAKVVFEDGFELVVSLYRGEPDPERLPAIENARRRHGQVVDLKILCSVKEGE